MGEVIRLFILAIALWRCSGAMDPYLVRHECFSDPSDPNWKMTLSNDTRPFRNALGNMYDHIYKGCDGEALDALEHYFWRYKNGTVMEIGAVDGTLLSQSLPFVENFGWRRILVEANPVLRDRLAALSGKVWAVNAAICENRTAVHYRALKSGDAKFSLTGGIVEFMSNRFARKMHNVKLKKEGKKTVVDYPALEQDPNVYVIECIPLREILATAKVVHVNLFVLDVEGGELSILHSIDWSTTRFDILVVETDPFLRRHHYHEDVVEFLKDRGYEFVMLLGRNAWFIHPDFSPNAKKRPGIKKWCYRGYAKSHTGGQCIEANHTRVSVAANAQLGVNFEALKQRKRDQKAMKGDAAGKGAASDGLTSGVRG